MGSKRPDDVPRSPTGRVPQWALDEATGHRSEPVPFRGASARSVHDPALRASRRRRGWILWVLVAVAVTAVAVSVAWSIRSR